jgi:hypothetical protein
MVSDVLNVLIGVYQPEIKINFACYSDAVITY